jgi:hypothetical protein
MSLAAGSAASAAAAAAAAAAVVNHASGDDLPGLLHNWGAGLHTISKHATVGVVQAACGVCHRS